jgi:putative transposase
MQQARNAAMPACRSPGAGRWMEDIGIKPTRILMDRDTKFTLQSRHFWRSHGVEPKRLPFRAAQMNAFVETFIGKLKAECLNFFVIFSLGQLDHIVATWLRHDHPERPHRGIGIGNRVLDPEFKPRTVGRICCRRELGGLIASYYREAA